MTSFSNSTTISVVLNVISAVSDSITVFIGCILIYCLVHRLIYPKRQQSRTQIQVPIILCINNLCILVVKSIIQWIHITLPTLGLDFQFINEFNDSLLCHFRAYLLGSILVAAYWMCALQAFFRFVRVIFPKRAWLHRPIIYLSVFIPCQFVFSFASILPIFLADAFPLLSNEAYCSISQNAIVLLIYAYIITFTPPLIIVCTCYIFVLFKMHRPPSVRSLQQRNRRDYLVIRRIVSMIVSLSTSTLLSTIVLIIYLSRGHLDPLYYRIIWFLSSVGSFLFMFILPFIDPQVHELFNRRKILLNL